RREREGDILANRHVDFVGGYEVEGGIRVAELPPPLMTDDVDMHGVGRRIAANVEDGLNGGHGDISQDESRRDRPHDLDAGVAVNLARARLTGPSPEAPDREEQQAFDQDEHEPGWRQNQLEQPLLPAAVLRDRIHGVLRYVGVLAY